MKKFSSLNIISLFESEFAPVIGKFRIFSQRIQTARISDEEYIWNPGCYVIWTPIDGVVKVGRSLSNSRKRSLEHIKDNTGGEMQKLENNPDARLILFNVRRLEDKHWIAAVEIFLEDTLKAKIPSKRRG